MKNKLFHKGFYLDTLKRIKGFALFVIIFTVATSAFSGLAVLGNYNTAVQEGMLIETSIFSLFDMVALASSLATVFVPVMTFMAFSFLYKRNESDFFEALPIDRGAMAISGLLAVMTVFGVSLIGSFLAYVLTTIPCIGNYYIIDAEGLLLELLASVLAAMLASAASLIGVSVTGVLSSGVGVTASIMFVPRMLMGIFLATLESHNSSLVSGKIIPLFNPEMNIHFALLIGGFKAQQTPWNYVYTAVVGLIMLICSVALFKIRGSESVTHRYVKHIYRHTVSILIAMLPIAMSMDFLMGYDDTNPLGFIAALIIFIIHERVGCGKRNKNKGGILAFISLIIVSSIYFTGITLVDNELSEYSPEADEIEYVSIVSTRGDNGWLGDLFIDRYLNYEDYVEMRAENIEIRDDDVFKIISEALSSEKDDSPYKSAVTVKIKSGGKVNYRKVYLLEEEHASIKSILAENESYNSVWLNIDEGARYPSCYYNGFQIGSDGTEDVLAIMKKEIADYGVDMYRESGYFGYSECLIHYTVYFEGEEYTISLPIYNYMEKTVQKLEEKRKFEAEKELSEFKSVLTEMISDGTLGSISIDCYANNDYYYIDIDASSSGFDAECFANELFKMVTSDSIEDYGLNNMSITLRREGGLMGSSYYSYSFAINSNLSSEYVKAFLKKYEVWIEVYE